MQRRLLIRLITICAPCNHLHFEKKTKIGANAHHDYLIYLMHHYIHLFLKLRRRTYFFHDEWTLAASAGSSAGVDATFGVALNFQRRNSRQEIIIGFLANNAERFLF